MYVCLFVYLGVCILVLDAAQEMVKDLICSNTYYKALAAASLLKVRIPKTGPSKCFQILRGWGLNKLVVNSDMSQNM